MSGADQSDCLCVLSLNFPATLPWNWKPPTSNQCGEQGFVNISSGHCHDLLEEVEDSCFFLPTTPSVPFEKLLRVFHRVCMAIDKGMLPKLDQAWTPPLHKSWEWPVPGFSGTAVLAFRERSSCSFRTIGPGPWEFGAAGSILTAVEGPACSLQPRRASAPGHFSVPASSCASSQPQPLNLTGTQTRRFLFLFSLCE